MPLFGSLNTFKRKGSTFKLKGAAVSNNITLRKPLLPAEISDRIIDHLYDDQSSLASCSLVCRSFVDASHHHLFQSFRFRASKTSKGFRPLVALIETKPSFLRHVRILSLVGRRDDSRVQTGAGQLEQRCKLCSHALTRILQTFPSLEDIRLSEIRFSHKRRKLTSVLRTRPFAFPTHPKSSDATQCEFHRSPPPLLRPIDAFSTGASGSPEDTISDFTDIFRLFSFITIVTAYALKFRTGTELKDFTLAAEDNFPDQMAFLVRYATVCSFLQFVFRPMNGPPSFSLTEFKIGLCSSAELRNITPLILEHGQDLTQMTIDTVMVHGTPWAGFDSADWGALLLADLKSLEQITFYLDFERNKTNTSIDLLICKLPLDILSRGVSKSLRIINACVLLCPSKEVAFKHSMDWDAWDEELVKLDLDCVRFTPDDEGGTGLLEMQEQWGWKIEDQLPRMHSLGKLKVL